MKRLSGLKPVIDSTSQVLILGSFPGSRSLARGEYYANRQNQFWRILSDILGDDLTCMSYAAKKKALLRHGIGLWDAIGSCRRRGSSDSAIRDVTATDVPGLLKRHPSVAALFANGHKAESVLARHARIRHKIVYLPSTSPAHGMTYRKKRSAWTRKIRPLLAK